MRKKAGLIVLSMLVSANVLSACTKTKADDTKTERTLRIATSMYGGENDYLRQQYTDSFELLNPNIKIEFVQTMENYQYKQLAPGEKMPDPYEKLKEAMQGDNPPDLVLVDYAHLPDMINNNLLAQLDPMIKKDKFDTTGLVSGVIDGLKKAGEGKLYALAPNFYSSALIYNKKMFTDAGVDFPKDDMTWDQMFDLARRVSKGEGDSRKYGFSFSSYQGGDIFYSMQNYWSPLQLTMFDDKAEKMTVDSPQWENVWKTMIQLQTEKTLPPAPDMNNQKAMMRSSSGDNPFAYDDFLSGRVAMTIMNFSQLSQITNANKNAANYKGFTPIEWDVVTIPSHPEYKGVVTGFSMNGIMAINAKAGNSGDAWKLIKFTNSEDWAKIKSHSSNILVSHKKYIKPKEGDYNIAAFYNIIPVPPTDMNTLYRIKPNLFQVQNLGRTEFMNALQGTKGVKEALKSWQTQGDSLLQQIKDNPNSDVNMGTMMKN